MRTPAEVAGRFASRHLAALVEKVTAGGEAGLRARDRYLALSRRGRVEVSD